MSEKWRVISWQHRQTFAVRELAPAFGSRLHAQCSLLTALEFVHFSGQKRSFVPPWQGGRHVSCHRGNENAETPLWSPLRKGTKKEPDLPIRSRVIHPGQVFLRKLGLYQAVFKMADDFEPADDRTFSPMLSTSIIQKA